MPLQTLTGFLLTFLPLRFSGGAFKRLPAKTTTLDSELTSMCTLQPLISPRPDCSANYKASRISSAGAAVRSFLKYSQTSCSIAIAKAVQSLVNDSFGLRRKQQLERWVEASDRSTSINFATRKRVGKEIAQDGSGKHRSPRDLTW